MEKYELLAEDILKNVGGKENVLSLTHCITRLRFKLKDEGKAKDEILKNRDDIVTVMKSGGQYQVVIGNHVPDVYAQIMKILGPEEALEDVKASGNLLSRGIDIISGIFQPILGIMAACGMVKGLNALFVAIGLYASDCGGFLILNAIGDGLFTFLPVFLGYTGAKKFGMKPLLGLTIGAIMCYPGIQAGALSAVSDPLYTLFEGTLFASPVFLDFFGIPVIAMDYTGTVIPVIFVVYFASKCEKLFSRVIPDLVKFFFVPMLTLLIAIPVGLMIIGPLATFGSTIIAEFVFTIRDFSPMLAGAIVGLTWQILVIFGLHWGFIPVYINNIMTNGYDNVMMPFFACTFATSAVVLAIFLKTKDKKLKEMALPNFISGIFGVTEPAIYSILLPLKKPFIISCIAGGIGGGFYGFFNFRKFMVGGMGIFEFPAMIEPDGSMGNLIVAVTGVLITMVIAFIMTMIIYKDDPIKEEESSSHLLEESLKNEKKIGCENRKVIEIGNPINGKILKLEDVKDAAFSSGVLGKGLGILPEIGEVYAPVTGEVTVLFPTLHAIGIKSEEGAEILIHVGLDTVQLEGQGFEAFIKQGDFIKKGQLLLKFDIAFIKKAGYSLETPVLITNGDDFLEVLETGRENEIKSLRENEPLLQILVS